MRARQLVTACTSTQTSRHHRLQAVPGDRSDDSDEWDIEGSEEEWDGPGDSMYRDYRRHQRSTFLVAHLEQREQIVREEMNRWKCMMETLIALLESPSGKPDQFAIDLHDLSLENIFVDTEDRSKIVSLFLAPFRFCSLPFPDMRH